MANITYSQMGDYLLPNIVLNEPQGAEPLTKYGMMRKRFLKEHRPIAYCKLLLSENLYPHCREVQRMAENRFDTMMEWLIERSPPPDKVLDGLAWAAHMNALKRIAEEGIFSELIYDDGFI